MFLDPFCFLSALAQDFFSMPMIYEFVSFLHPCAGQGRRAEVAGVVLLCAVEGGAAGGGRWCWCRD